MTTTSTAVRSAFLDTARTGAALLRGPAVAAAWDADSALAQFSVRGLAGHLALQVLAVPAALHAPVPAEPVVGLLDHYARTPWVGAPLDAAVNVDLRRGGEQLAARGPAALVAAVDDAVASLASELPTSPDRPVRLPLWGPWSLMLDDLLVTRMMELVVHSDDLAVSVGVDTPAVPQVATDIVIDLLARLATVRHGAIPVLRALSRAERAPATIAAF